MLWLLMLTFMMPLGLSAQNVTIRGNVTDADGEPIIGASIIEKDKPSNGTVSDLDGNFTINAPLKSRIVISYIGMKPEEVTLQSTKALKITLRDDAQALDEVVVIGYGTSRRGDLTGSISSVGEKTLRDIPVSSAAAAMTGRLAGVNVTTTDGSPDAEIQIRVRGGGSVTQDNSPLFIVDGFQVDNINDIPPTDIESIDVLKDASSTAIYGAKGANGVVLVTTKSGRAGKIEIQFNGSVGFSKVYNMHDMLSPYEYVFYQRELDPSASAGWFSRFGLWEDIDIYQSKAGTDWQQKMFGNTGVKQNYNVSLMGGSETLKYNISYTRDDETYIMKTSKFARNSINAKINQKIGKKLTIDLGMRMVQTVIDGPKVSTGNRLRNIVKYAPIGTLSSLTEDDLGGDIYNSEDLTDLNDPYYNIVNNYKKQNRFTNVYNLGITWEIIKGLSFRTQGSYTYQFDDTDDIHTNNTGEAKNNGGMPVANRYNMKGNRYSWSSTLQYKKTWNKKNRFDAMVGFEIDNQTKRDMNVKSMFYPTDFSAQDILAMWNMGTSQPTYTTIHEPNRSSSVFGRANYSYNDRYYITVTAREDGVSVFAPGKKWGFFPGTALAWRISEESFMEKTETWLSNLKLRLSYGLVGNARVGSYWRQNYAFETASNSIYYPGGVATGSMKPSSTLRNENLTWETKYSTNVGFDFGAFEDRLNLSVDFYNDVTKDLILAVQLPSHSGYTRQYQNLGQTTNRGVEFTLNGTIVDTREFYLSANFNIAFNKNKVNALDGNNEMIVSSNTADIGKDDYRVIVGQQVGLIYGYVADGMYGFDDFDFDPVTKKWVIKPGVSDCSELMPRSEAYFGPGHIKLKDLDGDGVITAEGDRKVIGNALPKATGGFGINASWKGFDLAALFNFVYGNDILNAGKIDFTTYSGSKKYQNLSSIMSMENRFITVDPDNGQNIYYGNYADPERLMELNRNARIWHPLSNASIITDWAVEDGSFLRFSNLTIGYTLPSYLTRRAMISRLRLYFTANNLFTWTHYSGQDPEVNTSGNNLTPGKDISAYPKCHSYIFGFTFTF